MKLLLGKLPPRMHAKTLFFEKYAQDELPVEPPKVYWGYKVPEGRWGMLGNNKRGNCVVAMAMHMDMNWTAHTGAMREWTEAEAIELYDRLSPRDEGLVMTDFFDFWRTEGMFGNKILGWMQFNHAVPHRFKQATWLFGAAAAGVEIAKSAMDQFRAGKTWTLVPKSPVRGGHAIPGFNFGAQGDKFLTWAKLQAAVNAWRDKYLDEAYAVISEAWFDVTTGLAPSHFNRDALWADLKKL